MKTTLLSKNSTREGRKNDKNDKTQHSYFTELYQNKLCKKSIIDWRLISRKNEKKVNQVPELPYLEYSSIDATNGYLVQRQLKSEYISRIVGEERAIEGLAVFEQDYTCLLSEYPLQNLNFTKRMSIFNSIAKAVKTISEQNICHRMISPSSVCIKRVSKHELTAKLNHFEYSIRLTNNMSLIAQNLVKTAFTAPQIVCNLQYGLMSDIWSLGALLNYLLYGTVDNIWESQNVTKIQVPDGTPEWLLQLLKSMLHHDDRKRYSIRNILQIVKTAQKCSDTLNKFVPIRNGYQGFKRIQSKLKIEQQGFQY